VHMRNQMLRWDGDDLYWSELRPDDAGRIVVCRRDAGGTISDVTPPGFNARTRVHEYGGGHFAVSGGTVWFTNYKDQRVYRQDRGGRPRPITLAADVRHADMVVDDRRGRLFASYPADIAPTALPPAPTSDGYRFQHGHRTHAAIASQDVGAPLVGHAIVQAVDGVVRRRLERRRDVLEVGDQLLDVDRLHVAGGDQDTLICTRPEKLFRDLQREQKTRTLRSQIERAESSASVTSLYKIAHALKIRLTELFARV